MAKSQENGTTILLGLKDYKVEEVRGGEERVVKTAVTGKEKMRELYRQASREEAAKLLDNIIFNLKSADDAELIRGVIP